MAPMAMTTGWSNTARGNAIVVLATGAVCGVLFAAGAVLYAIPVMLLSAFLILMDQFRDQKHHHAHLVFATQRGWSYTRRSQDYSHRFGTYPFGLGLNRHHTHVLEGIYRDFFCVSFTHHWTDNTQPNRKQEDHAYSIVMVTVEADVPRIDVISSDIDPQVERLVGGSKVRFADGIVPDQWQVRSQDGAVAHTLLTAPLMARWTTSATPGHSLRFESSAVMMWHEGVLSVDTLEDRLNLVTSVAGLMNVRERT